MSAKPNVDKQAKAYLAKILKKPAKNEHCLQRAIVRWCNGMGAGMVRDRYAAIPNGGTRGADAKSRMIAGARLKAEGVRAGVPDLVFWSCDDAGGAKTLWLEVKLGTSGVISPAQKLIHASLLASRHNLKVVRTLSDAIIELISFFSFPTPPKTIKPSTHHAI